MRSTLCPAPRRPNSHHPAATSTRTTTAVMTARLPFISPFPPRDKLLNLPQEPTLSGPTLLHCGPRLALRFAPLDRFPLVVRLLSLREADRHFDVAIVEVHPRRHERHPSFRRLAYELPDFLSAQQQLAAARRLVI